MKNFKQKLFCPWPNMVSRQVKFGSYANEREISSSAQWRFWKLQIAARSACSGSFAHEQDRLPGFHPPAIYATNIQIQRHQTSLEKKQKAHKSYWYKLWPIVINYPSTSCSWFVRSSIRSNPFSKVEADLSDLDNLVPSARLKPNLFI
jgi:hypothetical protein